MSFRDNFRKITPYVPGRQPKEKDMIKLNTNECPYPPAQGIKNILNNYDIDSLRLYPSFTYEKLKGAMSKKYNIKEDMLFFGNGSDEVLALCFLAFFNSDKKVLFPNITYSFYDVWCELYNIKYDFVPLDENFKIKPEDYKVENGGIVIANPNAPTGIYMPLEKLEEIISYNKDSVVIVDEAYIDFGGESAIGLVEKYENLVVVQTFSKSRALAGIRFGFAVANEELVQVLESVKNSFNSYTIDTLCQEIALESVLDDDYFNECRNKIIKTRQYLVEELDKLGFETLDSKSNFIFTTHKDINANELYKYLEQNKIFVRYFNKPLINNYLRISIGTEEQTDKLLEKINEFRNI